MQEQDIPRESVCGKVSAGKLCIQSLMGFAPRVCVDLCGNALQILELGAGCGYLGMTIARNLPTAHVCVTEMEYGGALEHLQHNVNINRLVL